MRLGSPLTYNMHLAHVTSTFCNHRAISEEEHSVKRIMSHFEMSALSKKKNDDRADEIQEYR